MFLFTTEKPILRWNFFPSSEMVFSRSIWNLKWLNKLRLDTFSRRLKPQKIKAIIQLHFEYFIHLHKLFAKFNA